VAVAAQRRWQSMAADVVEAAVASAANAASSAEATVAVAVAASQAQATLATAAAAAHNITTSRVSPLMCPLLLRFTSFLRIHSQNTRSTPSNHVFLRR